MTERTPEERVRAFAEGISEGVIVHGHTHVQYERTVAGRRVLNPGSVGIPYEDGPGAYWALLGPDVELRRTEYDVRAGADLLIATSYPRVEEYLGSSLLDPIPRDNAVAEMEPADRRGP